MNEGNTERFAILLDLTKQIADTNSNEPLAIIRDTHGNWIVTFQSLRNSDGNIIQVSNTIDTLEKALEQFVLNPKVKIP